MRTRLLLALCLAPALGAAAPQQAVLQVDPPELPVGLSYGGAEIRVGGTMPAADGAAIVVRGEESPLALKVKGKVGGLFWMNVAEAEFEHVPACYYVFSSGPLAGLGSEQALAEFEIGYAGLAIRPAGAAAGGGRGLVEELVRLKEREGLFGVFENGLAFGPAGAGVVGFSCTLRLPSRVPEGKWRIRLVAFRAGRGELLSERILDVYEAGAAAWIRSLALEHGLLYGIAAVATALAAGLLTGFLFDLGSKGGH